MPTAEACARADRPVLRALLFEKDRGVRELPADALPDHAQPTREQLLWVDVQTPDGVPAVLECLGARMDAFEPERAGEIGLVVYDDWRHLFVRALHWRLGDEPIAMPLSLAIGPNVVVTCRRGPLGFIDAVLDNEADHLRVGRLESTVFAMALLDRMLTDYLDGRDAFETLLDRLELKILRRPRSRHLVELQRLRHLASKLRRHLAGQRDLFDAIARPDFDPDQSSDAERACRLISVRYLRVTESKVGS